MINSTLSYTCGFKSCNFDSDVGTTTYYQFGDQNGEVIVLVPGFLCTAVVFNKIITELSKKNYRIITYDLFGTGGSLLQTKSNYDLNLFVEQLDSLIKFLNIKKLSIIGFSMGCIIASEFSRMNSRMIRKLILLGPAGVKVQFGQPHIVKIMKSWLIGALFINYVSQMSFLSNIKSNFYDSSNPDIQEDINHLHLMMYSSWLHNPTYAVSISSILNNFSFEGCESLYENLNCSINVILAENDLIIPLRENNQFWEKLSTVKVNTIPYAGHWFIYEKYYETMNTINDILSNS